MSTVAYRAATADDVDALAQMVVDGVEDYPSFAPAGWTPPSAGHEAERLRELLPDERVWCLVAEFEGELVGQVTVLPASISARPTDEPGLAHLANLFVRRDHWGTDIARRLTTAAVDEARERGYASMRLFVAEGQARARRFYEREGWSAAADPFVEPALGLTLVEYRITVRHPA
jgi:predicted N-acetyltransferase YhbS